MISISEMNLCVQKKLSPYLVCEFVVLFIKVDDTIRKCWSNGL